jgi:predicted RNA polymerase sigma factor
VVLTAKQLVVVRLRVRGRMGVTEIAGAVGLDKSTVCQHLSRAKSRLVESGLMSEGDDWDEMYELIEGLSPRGKGSGLRG